MTYQKLIANHVADILCMPTSILAMFQQGGFVVSITGRAWHSVGSDKQQPDPTFSSSAEESDTRIWLNASKSNSEFF